MEIYKIKNLNFSYPESNANVLENINLSVKSGEFITLCGKSGCGKTTLLRLLKPSIAPSGTLSGEISFCENPLNALDERKQASDIGFVMQNPDNQIVTDKVWHELSFGLESLGLSTPEIRTKISEMASFFGIHNWFYKKTSELSGGQKQLLNLASTMVMKPKILILDEPTSQLDPVAASDFLNTLKKINEELGTTVILADHRLEEAFAMSQRVIVMDEGKIISDTTPKETGKILKELKHDMYNALPVPMRVFAELEKDGDYPVSIREGRDFIQKYSETSALNRNLIPSEKKVSKEEISIEIKDIYFRYERELPDVIKGLNLTVYKGEFFAILGGNGTGKTTALSLVAGINSPQRGSIFIKGRNISSISNLYDGIIGFLPQNPQILFAKKTVWLDLYDITDKSLANEQREEKVQSIANLCRIEKLLYSHPYDLSGGEQQRVALAMVLLKQPEILLLDEPTKGMDAHFKKIFADILKDLQGAGVTILAVSHDIEFCAEFAQRCALFFDGSITSSGTPREFFSGNTFYTTAAGKMAGDLIYRAITADDIIIAAGIEKEPVKERKAYTYELKAKASEKPDKPRLTFKKIVLGIIFALLFAAAFVLKSSYVENYTPLSYILQGASIIFAAVSLICFFPQKEFKTNNLQVQKEKRKLSKRTLAVTVFILIIIPLTIFFGIYYLGDRKYYFISLAIIFETLFPFCMIFEKRKPEAREIVIISVLCAIGVAGRTAFFMIPEFKPVAALVIISGICFGGESGFLIGAVTAFVSNFFFGQGPWTPWQMFAFGMVGFLAGILFKKGFLLKTRLSLSVAGFLLTLIVYGGIMNPASVLMMSTFPSWDMIKASFIMGLPIDLIHSLSTAFFLWFISEPMIEKLERIKIKYGLIEI